MPGIAAVFMDPFRAIDLPRSATAANAGEHCSKSNKDAASASVDAGANSETRPA